MWKSTRGLARAPRFLLTTVFTLALGIASSVTLFAIVNGALLNPLPYKNSGRLAVAAGTVLGADFRDIRIQNNVFDQMALYERSACALSQKGQARPLECMSVSADFFGMLGVS